MKRIREKVKDIVEVRSFRSLRDFMSDPAETLSSYHFTDATSELMANWLDRIANVQNENGTALALAGYRGVGKSHFLACLGALASHPELRSRITEAHVANSAQRLLRRHYPVAYVRRGIHETLREELTDALQSAVGIDASVIGDSWQGVLKAACGKTPDLPFILIIDTAFERGERVTRDDGPFLAEIAEAAKDLNIFLGVALDDDIAGADGSNSDIAKTFTIDYLDQEHLYKVVNTHIFPKSNQMQPVLHDIYEYFREVLPGFRWSEQRFAALYPLHPVILEIAPFVRLYVHDFALLGFASDAGERILGRPANSLIAIDEVFDRTERSLRNIDDLKEAFAAYDKLNTDVVAKLPVMQRLQAKLILKALLLLSLNGQGSGASEIAASILIFDETDPFQALKTVEDLIKQFADSLPDDVRSDIQDGRETRYGFKVSSKDNLNKALDAAIAKMSPEVVPGILRSLVLDRFSDCTFSVEADENRRDWMDCQILWRGGTRRGRIFWNAGDGHDGAERSSASIDSIDWEVEVDFAADARSTELTESEVSRVYWKPDDLRKDEIDTLLRYHALCTHTEFREDFGEQLRATMHSHTLGVGTILNRILLEDGKLVIDGFDYNFTEEARSADTLSGLFTIMLEPLFETRYPAHPYFTERLGMTEVASLVTDLYSGTRQHLVETQQLAHTFARPLGLVKQEGGMYVPETEETLRSLPWAAEILALVESKGSSVVSLRSVYTDLRKPPNGLVREAQQLILAALVAQRLIEFVTSSGDRINRRSLDLKIIWDDVAGIAKPIEVSFSAKKLNRWAAIITGNTDFKSLDDVADRESLRTELEKWADEWNEARILEQFGQLPDDILNTRIWRLSARAAKTLGSAAENINAALDGSISLEECLDRVAETFSDSEVELENCRKNLAVVDSFIKGAALRDEIEKYLAVCEATHDENIEEIREKLAHSIVLSYSAPSDASNREMSYLWEKFQREFSEYFASQHEIIMSSHSILGKCDEVLRSDKWWEFENLSAMPGFKRQYWLEAEDIRQELRHLGCNFDVKEALKARPFCICTFSLAKIPQWENLAETLSSIVDRGLVSCHRALLKMKDDVVPALADFASKTQEKEFSTIASDLAKTLQTVKEIPPLSDVELKILKHILAEASSGLLASSGPQKKASALSDNKTPPASDQWPGEISDDVISIDI